MRLVDAEVILRVNVVFDKEETSYLRQVGHLPPQGDECVSIWVTIPELTKLKELHPTLGESIESIIDQTNSIIKV